MSISETEQKPRRERSAATKGKPHTASVPRKERPAGILRDWCTEVEAAEALACSLRTVVRLSRVPQGLVTSRASGKRLVHIPSIENFVRSRMTTNGSDLADEGNG